MLVCENKHLSALRVTPAAWMDLSAAARRGIMFTLVMSEDDIVIHMAQYTFVSSQDCIHPPLKLLGSTGDAEWQSLEIEATKGGDRSGQLLGIFMQ